VLQKINSNFFFFSSIPFADPAVNQPKMKTSCQTIEEWLQGSKSTTKRRRLIGESGLTIENLFSRGHISTPVSVTFSSPVTQFHALFVSFTE